MTATHNIARKIGRSVDGLADHEGSELNLVLVHQVEDSRDALVHAVLEDAVSRQIGQVICIGSSKKPGAPEMGCPPPSNMSEKLMARRAPLGQKESVVGMMLSFRW
jgi:hypothetical protein